MILKGQTMTSSSNSTHRDANRWVDVIEIERQARQLRAETMRQLAATSAAAFRRAFARMTGKAAPV